jgi:SAM-dependent methyltransferase
LVDYVWDLEEGLPSGCKFQESFDLVIANHVLEHIVKLRQLMHEIYMVLKSGGLLKIRYPIGHNSFESIDHVHYFNERTFDVFVTDRGVNVGDFWLIEQKEMRETEVEVWLRKS